MYPHLSAFKKPAFFNLWQSSSPQYILLKVKHFTSKRVVQLSPSANITASGLYTNVGGSNCPPQFDESTVQRKLSEMVPYIDYHYCVAAFPSKCAQQCTLAFFIPVSITFLCFAYVCLFTRCSGLEAKSIF